MRSLTESPTFIPRLMGFTRGHPGRKTHLSSANQVSGSCSRTTQAFRTTTDRNVECFKALMSQRNHTASTRASGHSGGPSRCPDDGRFFRSRPAAEHHKLAADGGKWVERLRVRFRLGGQTIIIVTFIQASTLWYKLPLSGSPTSKLYMCTSGSPQ